MFQIIPVRHIVTIFYRYEHAYNLSIDTVTLDDLKG